MKEEKEEREVTQGEQLDKHSANSALKEGEIQNSKKEKKRNKKQKDSKKQTDDADKNYKKYIKYVVAGVILFILIMTTASFAYNNSTVAKFEKFIIHNQVEGVTYKESSNTLVYTLKPKARKAEVKKAEKVSHLTALRRNTGLYEVRIMKDYFTLNKDIYHTIQKNHVNFDVKTGTSVLSLVLRMVYIGFLLIIAISVLVSLKGMFGDIDLEKADTDGLTFDDVGGLSEVKKELNRLIYYLNNRDKVSDYVDKIPKGVLFEGAPGNGKTLLAKVIASVSNTPFFYVSAAEVEGSFVGEGSKRVKSIFKKLRKEIEKSGSAILFLDELDAVGMKRESRSVAETSQTLNQLLTELDGFKEEDNLLVIGATNLVSKLDSALIRSGRFDRIIKIPNPNEHDRKEIMNIYIEKKKDKFDDTVFRSDFVDVLSIQTEGFSSSDLSRLVSDALLMAFEEDCKVTNKHLRNAYLQIVMGLPSTEPIDEEKRKIVAYHESGHAIVTMLTSSLGYAAVAYGTIRPYGEFGGHISYIEPRRTLRKKSDYLNNVRVLLAGRAVENILLNGDYTDGAYNDLQKVRELLVTYVSKVGMSDNHKNYFNDVSSIFGEVSLPISNPVVDTEVNRLVAELSAEVDKMVADNFEEIKFLAEYLLEHTDIEREDIIRLYSEKYPKKEGII